MTDLPQLLARSQRLGDGKFADVLAQSLRQGERVLLIDDCDAEIFEFTRLSPKSDLVAVLTADRLLLLRGRGLMGGSKRPWILDLTDLEHVAVTAEGNVNLRFTQRADPGIWKLVFRDTERADLWMQEIGRACQPGDETGDGAWMSRLHDCLEALTPFAAPDNIGVPFGPGAGLEEAVQVIQTHLQSPSEARSCGRVMITELLTQVPGEDPELSTLTVMGVAELRDGGGAKGRQELELAGAAMVLIDQSREPGSLWKLWEERDDVAAKLLAWHCIARLRLAAQGLAPPVSRPASA